MQKKSVFNTCLYVREAICIPVCKFEIKRVLHRYVKIFRPNFRPRHGITCARQHQSCCSAKENMKARMQPFTSLKATFFCLQNTAVWAQPAAPPNVQTLFRVYPEDIDSCGTCLLSFKILHSYWTIPM